MNKIIPLICCLSCAAVAFLVLGINYFAAFQLLPIIVFYLFQRSIFKNISNVAIRLCYIFAILILLAFPLMAQLSWHFDINGSATRSSTSGLLFVFLPIYATLPGLLPCTIAAYLKQRQKRSSSN